MPLTLTIRPSLVKILQRFSKQHTNNCYYLQTNRGFYPYTCWAQLAPSEKRGEFSSVVKGDLNVFRVALSPDDWTFCDSWCFLLPKHFYFPQLFPGSILLPPVIGVDAPPPIYSGRECWKRTKNTQTSNTTLCVCTKYTR